jgi:signal transduction histidine kinase
VLQELDRLADISQRLLTVLQVDRLEDRDPVALDEELGRITNRWRRAAPRDWQVTCSPGTVLVSRERLEAVVDCLLDNAVKFSGPTDVIQVTGEVSTWEWTLRIANTGTTLSADDAEALTAGKRLPRRDQSGTGIGVVMARTVIEGWGGRITFNTGTPNGAVVTVRVPAIVTGSAHTLIPSSSGPHDRITNQAIPAA